MIALVIFVSLSLGTVLGWFGHKISLHIAVWGIHMNEQDRALQDIVDSGVDADSRSILDNLESEPSSAGHLTPELVSAKHHFS